MTPAAVHLDLASWVLAATFLVFLVVLACGVVTSWRDGRRPRRPPGVIEAVFALRHAGLIESQEAQDILGRYDASERHAAMLERGSGGEVW
jgi:hypothetical protein